MEKQDILVVAISILAFAVLALLVKPLLIGPSIGLPGGGSLSEGTSGSLVTQTVPVTTVARTPVPAGGVQTVVPTPTGTPWDGTVKSVGFVGQPEGQVTLTPNPTLPQPSAQNRSLVTYARIVNSGSGTTETLYIPAPRWVLEYTADPWALPPNAYPVFILQVFDAHDPNRVVIAPIEKTIFEEPPDTPWSEKIFEGNRRYYFKVDTSFIKSYTITIKIPLEYT
jgi:hypothetical protein